ncbi:MAG TPA: phosphoribosylanthranilate isomerase [Dehalococcoidia bacterium]|nr:phosphoribosylanthranilate isomerase [Dehalococcoidia bacterium]
MTLVKICGITNPVNARAAAAFGADFIGMVFAPSRRQVTIGQGKRIAEALGKREPAVARADVAQIEAALQQKRPLLVGVFADQDPDTINSIADECGLDLVQLSGNEPWELNEHIRRPIFKCLKIRDEESADELMAHYHGGCVLLLDPYVEGTYGGTGRRVNWDVAADIAKRTPTILAGGLTPENIREAVTTVRPWCVDVSSGVETDGAKDPAKIRAFMGVVREAHVGST